MLQSTWKTLEKVALGQMLQPDGGCSSVAKALGRLMAFGWVKALLLLQVISKPWIWLPTA